MQKQIGFWLLALLAFIALIFLLRTVLLPFAAGLVLAYLLDPVARQLEKLGIGRFGATLVMLLGVLVVFVLIVLLLVPILGNQMAAFAAKLPDTIQRLQTLVAEQGGPMLERFGGAAAMADIQKSLGDIVSASAVWIGSVLAKLWSGGQAIVGVISLVIVTPVVAFYLLLDWDSMVAAVDSWLPRAHAETIRGIVREIDRAIAGFVRGQALVCLILGSIYAVGLTMIGLNFGFLIGFSAGLLSFIPFVGSMSGLIISVIVAIVQFWPHWTMILAVLAVFGVGQFLEGNVLSPKLVGESVGLHPVWLMFALFAFGSLFGFLGLLLAVPLAAAVGVLVRFALRQYLLSPLYGVEEGPQLPKPWISQP